MKSIALLAFGLMLCIVVFRNPIAKFAAVKIASSALGGHVEIDRLELGLSRIRLSGVHVAEPGREDLPQIEWKSLDVQPTILRGLRTGVWLNKVEVVEPVLHLRFDAAGNLISTFPAKGESEEETGPLTIPVKSVSVRKARLVVHQIGREDFEIRDVEFLADCDQQIIGKLSVPDFLGAKIECSCLLSSETFAGSSQLRIDDLQISTSKLAKLPFIFFYQTE